MIKPQPSYLDGKPMLRRFGPVGNGSAHRFDKGLLLPIAAVFFAAVAFPLLIHYSPSDAMEARPETRLFWPLMFGASILRIANNRSRLTCPPHIVCLLVYVAFAGVSILWAFSPDRSVIRYIQQVMIIVSIVPPVLIASRTSDVMQGLFLCLAVAMILNIYYIYIGETDIVTNNFVKESIGYRGYFSTKNQLGECASISFLLCLNELSYRGKRRICGGIVIIMSLTIIWFSNSKTAFSLAFLCPFIAFGLLFITKTTRMSLAVIILVVPLCYGIAALLIHSDLFGRISFMLYHDSTLTGRTVIWDFVKGEIARRPFIGWGYQSFWFVPNSPALTEAKGWVRLMPNSHNGYYDTMLELGYVGFVIQIAFILATMHAIGRVAQRDWRRAQLLLSLTIFFLLYNFFESLWVRSFELLWLVFLVGVAETGRCLQPLPTMRGEPKARRRSPPPAARAFPAPRMPSASTEQS